MTKKPTRIPMIHWSNWKWLISKPWKLKMVKFRH